MDYTQSAAGSHRRKQINLSGGVEEHVTKDELELYFKGT